MESAYRRHQAPQEPWAVYYDGNFWGHHGQEEPGRELPVGKTFPWGEGTGYVPAVYVCGQGLAADICISAPAAQVDDFVAACLAAETEEEQEALVQKHPLGLDLGGQAEINGRRIRSHHGCGLTWLPHPPEGEENSAEAARALGHYGLDPSLGWAIRRMCFPWPDGQRPAALGTLGLTLEPEEREVPGPAFTAEPGRAVEFTHPVTGTRHVLTVEEREHGQLPEAALAHLPKDCDYPRWYETVTCAVEPALPGEKPALRDRSRGDRPRRQPVPRGTGDGPAAVGIIGGADGPTAFYLGGKPGDDRTLCGCSGLYFREPDGVEWQLIFRQRPWEAVALDLISEPEHGG